MSYRKKCLVTEQQAPIFMSIHIGQIGNVVAFPLHEAHHVVLGAAAEGERTVLQCVQKFTSTDPVSRGDVVSHGVGPVERDFGSGNATRGAVKGIQRTTAPTVIGLVGCYARLEQIVRL